jgi:hypothetical protein
MCSRLRTVECSNWQGPERNSKCLAFLGRLADWAEM